MIEENALVIKLIKQGYIVAINDPKAVKFPFKYKVYQNSGNLKAVIVNDRGVVVALQG
jgi:hypothetical protein